MNKEFDCVKYQRDIRDKFISEAGENFEQLLLLLNQKENESELYHFFKSRKKNEKQLKTA